MLGPGAENKHLSNPSGVQASDPRTVFSRITPGHRADLGSPVRRRFRSQFGKSSGMTVICAKRSISGGAEDGDRAGGRCNQGARGAGSQQRRSSASDIVKRRVFEQAEFLTDRRSSGAQFGGVALVPSGLIANLDDRVLCRAPLFGERHDAAWCLTAANGIMTVSAKQGPQTATCQRTGASSSGQPTTASVGPPRRNVQVPTRSPPTTFHWRGPVAMKEDARLHGPWRSDMRGSWNSRSILTFGSAAARRLQELHICSRTAVSDSVAWKNALWPLEAPPGDLRCLWSPGSRDSSAAVIPGVA